MVRAPAAPGSPFPAMEFDVPSPEPLTEPGNPMSADKDRGIRRQKQKRAKAAKAGEKRPPQSGAAQPAKAPKPVGKGAA